MAASPDILTGKDGQPFVPIEEKHGEDCTCRAVGRIELDLVAASRTCPGDRNPHRGGTVTAQLEDRQAHEVHLVTWDGPIEWLELRFKPGVEVRADWGQRIAEAAKAIVAPGNPTVRFRRGVDGHIHQFPAKAPLTVPHQYVPCECGETFGGEDRQTTEENQP